MFDYHTYKSVINRYFTKHVDGNNRPTFFDIDETYPSLNKITRNHSVILKEFIHAFDQRQNLPQYH